MGKFFSGPNKKDATPDEIANDLVERFENSADQIKPIRDNHVKYLKYYYGIAPDLPEHKKNAGASNIFVPLIEPLTDTLVAKFLLTLAAHNPFIRYTAEEDDPEAIVAARLMERKVKYDIMERMPDGITNLRLVIGAGTLFGTGILHVCHKTKFRYQTRIENIPHPQFPEFPLIDPNTGEPAQQEVVEKIPDYSGLYFEVVDIDDFGADWTVSDIDDTWVIHRQFVDPEVYLERVEDPFYQYLPISEEEFEVLLEDPKKDSIPVLTDSRGGINNTNENRKKVCLLHYYGKGYVKGIRQDIVCTALYSGGDKKGNRLVMEARPCNTKPFCLARLKPKFGELLGRGIGDMIYDLQSELNTTRNQRIDNLAQELNGGWLFEDGSVEDERMLDSKPGQKVKYNGPSIPQKIPRQPLPPDSFTHDMQIQQDAKSVTASEDILRGRMERKETATTAAMLNSNAGQRIEATIFCMAHDFIRNLGTLMKNLNIDYTPPDDLITIKLSEDEIDKFKDEFKGLISDTGYISAPARMLNRAMYATTTVSALEGDNRVKSQGLLQMLQILMPFAATGWRTRDGGWGSADLNYILKEIARLEKLDELKEMFISVPPPSPEQLAAQQGNGASVPQEVGGQAMMQPPAEAVNQQMGVAQMIDSNLASS